MMTSPTSSEPIVIQWVLDTRNLWPEVSETKQLPSAAPQVFRLLTPSEKESVLRYYFVRDAKLALGSILLKRHVLSSHLHIPWDSITFTRDERTKPVFLLPDGREPVLFNVSHQAGLVALLAVKDPPGERTGSSGDFAVGVDVVCPEERRARDHDMIDGEGWGHFVEVHDQVFSPQETEALKAMGEAEDKDTRLAYFYALWCLREAYVKMTGDALLASWLRDLDFRGFAPPGKPPLRPDGTLGAGFGAGSGHATTGLEIFINGEEIDDVEMVMSPLWEEYMICASVRRARNGKTVPIGEWESVYIDDILVAAEASMK